jgi:hypothetical protein
MCGGITVPAATAPRPTLAFTLAPASRETDALADIGSEPLEFAEHWTVVLNRLPDFEKLIGVVFGVMVLLNEVRPTSITQDTRAWKVD